MEFNHKPIMLNEILSGLNINPDGVYMDCTIGGAGHSKKIIEKLTGKGLLIGIDKDYDALNVSTERLKEFNNKKLIHSDFNDIENVFEEYDIPELDGILIDLGISSYQIDTAERGFSFLRDGKLDMRMDQTQKLSAYEVVNTYSKEKLTKILFEYGEEQFAKQIVNNIIKNREIKPIETTFELRDIIEKSLPAKVVYKSGGASKKTFQAIRIEVNGELDRLEQTINYLITKLKMGGRIAILTFHSLEDRIVKNVFKECSTSCICPPKMPVCICNHKASLKVVNKKPVTASDIEMQENSRSTCAKLRIAEKI